MDGEGRTTTYGCNTVLDGNNSRKNKKFNFSTGFQAAQKFGGLARDRGLAKFRNTGRGHGAQLKFSNMREGLFGFFHLNNAKCCTVV